MRWLSALLLCTFLFGFYACEQQRNESDQGGQDRAAPPPLADKGGILLRIDSLMQIFEEEGINGIVLGVVKESGGRVPNARLEIGKTYWGTPDSLFAKKLPRNNGIIAGGIKFPSEESDTTIIPPEDLEFPFKNILETSKFSFGLITKEQIQILSRLQTKYLLITGFYMDNNEANTEPSDLIYSFEIRPYQPNIKIRNLAEALGIPAFMLSVPCPPHWV